MYKLDLICLSVARKWMFVLGGENERGRAAANVYRDAELIKLNADAAECPPTYRDKLESCGSDGANRVLSLTPQSTPSTILIGRVTGELSSSQHLPKP